MKKLEETAEKWAKQCVQTRGNPHWHDVRDAFLAGHASRDAEVEKLRAVAAAAREYVLCVSLANFVALKSALEALDSEKGEGR
jgi:hypothetical protein